MRFEFSDLQTAPRSLGAEILSDLVMSSDHLRQFSTETTDRKGKPSLSVAVLRMVERLPLSRCGTDTSVVTRLLDA
jgi:hypothetical protein